MNIVEEAYLNAYIENNFDCSIIEVNIFTKTVFTILTESES